MRNKKKYARIGLIVECNPPRNHSWCNCKFKKIRYAIIAKACALIEALECGCERPEWTQEDMTNWLRQEGFIKDQPTKEEIEATIRYETSFILRDQV